MKKKFLTFLFTICFMLPCVFLLAACEDTTPPGGPTLNGYEEYIKCEKTNEFVCTWGEKTITAADIPVAKIISNKHA